MVFSYIALTIDVLNQDNYTIDKPINFYLKRHRFSNKVSGVGV